MSKNNTNFTEKLSQLLLLCKELKSLTHTLLAYSKNLPDDLSTSDKLNEITIKKDEIIKKMDDPLTLFQEILSNETYDVNKKIQPLIIEIKESIESTLQMEQECEKILKSTNKNFNHEITQLNRGKKIASAYNNQYKQQKRVIDIKK